MHTDWKAFLIEQGAIIDNEIVQNFGDPIAELNATAYSAVLCDLAQFSTLRVSGMDAESFLQNLLSNDIRDVTTSRAQYSSFNSAKGRMLADFLIRRDENDYLLQLPTTLAEALRKKLSMYILRAKVKITDVSNEFVSIGFTGSIEMPDLEALGVTQLLGATVIRLDNKRFQFSTSVDKAAALWQTLAATAKPVGSSCWDWLTIRAGIAVILPQTQEEFVPQMVNFDVIGGINFKKGCYPGQEIVARMHYLGKLKRRMYLAHINGAAQAGDKVFCADEQVCGMIVNAASSPVGGADVLVVMQIESHETQNAHVGSLQGALLTFENLPYPLP